MDLLGCRLVLNQLNQVVAIDHLARRGGHIGAESERSGINLLGPPAVSDEVVDHVAHAPQHAPTASLGGPERRGTVVTFFSNHLKGLEWANSLTLKSM